jgi:hypothetical protein
MNNEEHDIYLARCALAALAEELERLERQSTEYAKRVVPELPTCSFCGKGKNEVTRLLAGPAARICNECVGLCNELIEESADFPGPR